MKTITFSKYEALGNDFILIDESSSKSKEPATTIEQRQRLCHRKSGVGADGVITILAPLKDTSSVFMHVTNADGSIPENCGNGLRCVAQWLVDHHKIVKGQKIAIDTLSGPKDAFVDEMPTVGLGRATVDFELGSQKITNASQQFAKNFGVQEPKFLALVDLGNPHIIFETSDIELAQEKLGPIIEKLFERGVNASFVDLLSTNEIRIRVWERGAGATDACGSGAGASVAALTCAKKLQEGAKVRMHFKNGDVTVEARENPPTPFSKGGQRRFDVVLCGPARMCFSGLWDSLE